MTPTVEQEGFADRPNQPMGLGAAPTHVLNSTLTPSRAFKISHLALCKEGQGKTSNLVVGVVFSNIRENECKLDMVLSGP